MKLYLLYFSTGVTLGPETTRNVCFKKDCQLLFDRKTQMKCLRTSLADCVCLSWQRSCISTRHNVMYLNMFFSSFSPLRQAWDQAERAHLLSGNWRGLLRSPSQCHQGNQCIFYYYAKHRTLSAFLRCSFSSFLNALRKIFKKLLINTWKHCFLVKDLNF